MPLNPVVQGMAQASSIYVNQIVYDLRRSGADVTTLSLGEAFFDLPLLDFSKIDIARSFHYSESQGLPELRQRLASYYNTRYGTSIDSNRNLLISAGSKAVIYMALLTMMAPGDEVLVHEPAWLSYPEQARLVRGEPKFIPYDTPVERFHEHMSSRTRALILCNPNNPAGRIYSESEQRTIYEACRSRNICLLVDEAYSDFALDSSFVSMARIVPDLDGVVVVNSISKNLGISGWRIGYAISWPEFIALLLKVNQHIVTCAPTILQMYCAHYFDELIRLTEPQVRQVVEKRGRVAEMLRKADLDFLPGSATFYFFVSIGSFPGTSQEFATKLLLDHAIAVVPGSAYGRSTDRFVRLSIGTESEARIEATLPLIRALAGSNALDSAELAHRLQALSERLAGTRASGPC